MKYALTVAATMLLLGCMKTVDYTLPQSGAVVDRKPLTVPHREWLESGCWFRSVNGKDVKVCK